MKNPIFIVLLFIGLSIMAVALFSCGQEKKKASRIDKDTGALKRYDVTQIVPGPIQHDTLSVDQLERIKPIQEVLSEVYTITYEQWVDGFKRDLYPENSIRLWERMAYAYFTFTDGKNYSLGAKREIFGVLLNLSTTPEDHFLKEFEERDFKYISKQEAVEAIKLFVSAPGPPGAEKTE